MPKEGKQDVALGNTLNEKLRNMKSFSQLFQFVCLWQICFLFFNPCPSASASSFIISRFTKHITKNMQFHSISLHYAMLYVKMQLKG